MAIGCDGTNVNTGKNGDFIRLLEKQLSKPLQWIICLLHINELPLQHLFFHLDGLTSGLKSFYDPLGKAVKNCEAFPLVKFQKIEGDLLPKMTNDRSTDQKYLYRIITLVITGTFADDLGHKPQGKFLHFLIFASSCRNRKPDICLDYFSYVYYKISWFSIKNNPSCKDGTRHLFKIISSSSYLSENLKSIVDTVIQRYGYFAHADNLLLAMITDERKHIRDLAARHILKARSRNHTKSKDF